MNLISRRRFFCTPVNLFLIQFWNRFLEELQAGRGPWGGYFDPQADKPYLFYLAGVSVVRHIDDRPRVLDEVLVGVKQFSDGRCEQTPVHLLLTLTPESPNRSPISSEWIDLADDVRPIKTFVVGNLELPNLLASVTNFNPNWVTSDYSLGFHSTRGSQNCSHSDPDSKLML